MLPYDNPPLEEYLEHHGIKGMKWGVRRTPEQLGHRTSKSSLQTPKDSKKNQEQKQIKSQSSKERTKRVAIRTLQALTVSALLYQIGKTVANSKRRSNAESSNIAKMYDTGRTKANDWIKDMGKMPVSKVKRNKWDVDRSDWNWADYAWNEIEG